MRCLDGLDHVLIGASDLEQSRAQFERLGFATTPLGLHQGWASGNHCVMFAEDYLEILGKVREGDLPDAVEAGLARGDGLLGLAVTSSDPEGTFKAWTDYGLAPEKPASLSRPIETEGGSEIAQFRNVMLDPKHTAGVPTFACHHLTPDLLRPAPMLKHDNGAVAIRSMTIVADDPEPLTLAYRTVFGSSTHSGTDQVSAFQVGDAAIVVTTVEDAAVMHPAFTFPEQMVEARPMVLTIAVEDVKSAAECLETNNVPFTALVDETLAVQPEHAGGVMVEFVRRR